MEMERLERYEQLLKTRELQLAGQIKAQREEINVEPQADLYDEVTRSHSRGLAISNTRRATVQLKLVREALQRIKSGEFGFCQECEKPLAAKRLDAVPWAKYCVRCQDNQPAEEEGLDGSEAYTRQAHKATLGMVPVLSQAKPAGSGNPAPNGQASQPKVMLAVSTATPNSVFDAIIDYQRHRGAWPAAARGTRRQLNG